MRKYYVLRLIDSKHGKEGRKKFVAYRDEAGKEEVVRAGVSVLARKIVEDAEGEAAIPIALYDSDSSIETGKEVVDVEVLAAPSPDDLFDIAEEIAIKERAKEKKTGR